MSYYADLSPCDYFGPSDTALLAVGWLDSQHSFQKGRVDRAFFDALSRLLENPWQPFATAGRHGCELCTFTGGPAEIRVGEVTIAVGAANVFVPSDDGVFVAPSLIVHYIDAHEYVPPDAFQRAVIACPPMRSIDYLKALRSHGVHRLAAPAG